MLEDITPDPKKFQIEYHGGTRFVICFCGEKCRRSIVPHLREEHSEIWERWSKTFLDLHNEGWSAKRIMYRFSPNKKELLFSWTLIEKEIKRVVEEYQLPWRIKKKENIDEWDPKGFNIETSTLWSFPQRGRWAVHQSDYRGNWPPQVPRNLILKYTKPGDLVCDPFVGGGTTLIESWLLKRQSVGIDISSIAIQTTNEMINEMESKEKDGLSFLKPELKPLVIRGDSRNLVRLLNEHRIASSSVDLICAHPPYMNTLEYTIHDKRDLSRIKKVDEFLEQIKLVGVEMYKVLKKGGKCAILVGDIRRKRKVVPLGFKVMNAISDIGFELCEIIVKEQHRDSSSPFYKDNIDYLLAHEYLLIYEKET